MLPFSMQCLKCGEFMYRGKKFNSRKEDAIGEDYLGVRKYRFYIKCSVCSNEIAFKTDPKNQDYVCESGASRNYETWKQQGEKDDELEAERTDDNSAMKALETRTLDSKIEMDVLDALDEIKAHNYRSAKLGSKAIDLINARKRKQENDDEQQEINRHFFNNKTTDDGAPKPPIIIAKHDNHDRNNNNLHAKVTKLTRKKKKVIQSSEEKKKEVPLSSTATTTQKHDTTPTFAGLFGGYGSNSSSASAAGEEENDREESASLPPPRGTTTTKPTE